jgi:hypothetical protein
MHYMREGGDWPRFRGAERLKQGTKMMKNNKLNLAGTLLASLLISGCGKNEQTVTPGAAPSTSSSDAISLRAIYTLPMNGASYLLTELENTGKTGITAWQGKWVIKDDLDAVVADETIRYTSDTPYLPDGTTAHVISAGEKFYIIDQAVTGEQDRTFFCDKENLTKCGILPITEALKEIKLDDHKVTKKITFEVEKVVSP